MEARYLRVKGWSKKQHYDPLKRRPPWIKLYNTILDPGEDFMELTELEQWQLVRIWLVASRSERLTVEPETGKLVPVVALDEQSLRRSTMSLKKLPLEKLMRDGWLIPVAEHELISPDDASNAASTAASTSDSGSLSSQSSRGSEKDSTLRSDQQRSRADLTDQAHAEPLETLGERIEAQHQRAPFGSEGRLLEILTDMDDRSPAVIRSYLDKLPANAIEIVRDKVLARDNLARPTAYAVEVLKQMINDRRSAA